MYLIYECYRVNLIILVKTVDCGVLFLGLSVSQTFGLMGSRPCVKNGIHQRLDNKWNPFGKDHRKHSAHVTFVFSYKLKSVYSYQMSYSM